MTLRVAISADGGFDFVNSNGLELDEGLESDVCYSLFEDAPATKEELIEAGLSTEDSGGSWQNAFPEFAGDVRGSKLWLLARAKKTDETLEKAKRWSEEALQWLLDDEVAREVNVSSTWLYGEYRGLLILVIEIVRMDGTPWKSVWNAMTGSLLESTPA